MWMSDHIEGWTLTNWCFWTVYWGRLLGVPWAARRSNQSILSIHWNINIHGHSIPKNMNIWYSKLEYQYSGNQSQIFIGRTDAEAPILWPPDAKRQLIGKDLNAGKDWGQKEKEETEDETIGWHHWINGHEVELTPGVGDGQWGLACCSSWGHKESDTTERLNWIETKLV